VLAAPLTVGAELIGVLNVYSKSKSRWFSDREKELAGIFANHASIAIQNARQYRELEHAKGLVGARTALAWMGMASSAWRHAVDKHAQTIQEQSMLLREDLRRSLPRRKHVQINERLDVIERLTKKILEKPITPPLATEEGMASILLNDLVRARVRQIWQSQRYKRTKVRHELSLNRTTAVRVSPEWLRRAFDILVDNAVDAAASHDKPKITIGTRKANGGAEVFIRDNGLGIPKDVLPRLFQEPLERSDSARGLGMGLLMAQAIVQAYGGAIRVESTGPTGTTMVMWLPVVGE
jgi:signal transduction histidine kinase